MGLNLRPTENYIDTSTLIENYWQVGNVLVTRSHDKFLVIDNNHALGNEGRIYSTDYYDSLHIMNSSDGSMDIMAVYSCPMNLKEMNRLDTSRLLWEREV